MIDTPDLEAIAEGDKHAAWIVANHVGNGTERPRCAVCDEWWPCGMLGLAALAVLRAREADRLREMLGIATQALEYLSNGARTGKAARHMSTMADDALTRMSVVE